MKTYDAKKNPRTRGPKFGQGMMSKPDQDTTIIDDDGIQQEEESSNHHGEEYQQAQRLGTSTSPSMNPGIINNSVQVNSSIMSYQKNNNAIPPPSCKSNGNGNVPKVIIDLPSMSTGH